MIINTVIRFPGLFFNQEYITSKLIKVVCRTLFVHYPEEAEVIFYSIMPSV